MTKVLIVCYGFGYGGIRACIQNYVSHIDRDKFQIDIYAYGVKESPFKEQFESMGCKMFLDPTNDIATNKIMRFVGKLRTYIKEGQYDVVHAHCNLISAWVTLAAKLAGAKVRISHSHSTAHFSGKFIQNCWCYLRRWIINYTATTKMACGEQAGLTMYGNSQRVIVLPNGIDINRYYKLDEGKIAALRKEFDIQPGVKVYMNITRFDRQKNLPFVAKIFKEIHEIEPTSILIFGGTVSDLEDNRNIIKEFVVQNGLSDFVRFVGPRMDIQHLYHLSDCWIFPSKFEGLPFCPIELQAASIPCLASDVITNEIDLGLGLIEFMSLDESPKEWAEKAILMSKKIISYEVILKAFQDHDFDIRINVKKLESIYKGELK